MAKWQLPGECADRAHLAAVAQHRRGLAARWRACFAVSVVVGQQRRHLTRALATDLACSVDQVEHMAQAARFYLDLARHFRNNAEVVGRLRQMRRVLSPSHFSELGRLTRTYDLTPGDALGELATAAGDGVSVAAMAQGVAEANKAVTPTPLADYARALARLASAIAAAIRQAEIANVKAFRLTNMAEDVRGLLEQAQTVAE